MTRYRVNVYSSVLSAAVLAFLVGLPPVTLGDDDKELRNQRREAQKARQQEHSERVKTAREARKEFRQFARDLEHEFKEQVQNLYTDFEMQRVEIEAEHETRIAEATAEHQKNTSALLTQPGLTFEDTTVSQIQQEWRSHSDRLFDLKKEYAERLFEKRMEIEKQKHELLLERDRMAFDQAAGLGLTQTHQPMLAEPLGGALTDREQRWNERQKREVEKLHQQDARVLESFRVGESLREWEMANLREDFELEWQEKSERHAVDAQQVFFNTLLLRGIEGDQSAYREFRDTLTDLAKERELIEIEYDKIRKQERIQRREEKREILQAGN